MPEQLLHDPQIGVVFQHMRSEAVTQPVRVHALAHRCGHAGVAHDALHRPSREPPTGAVEEQRPLGALCHRRAALVEPRPEGVARREPEERHARALALTHDVHLPVREVEVAAVQRGDLADAQPGAVEQLQQRGVAQRARTVGIGLGGFGVARLHERADLVLGEEAGEALGGLRVAQPQDRVARRRRRQAPLVVQPAVERADRRSHALHRGGRALLLDAQHPEVLARQLAAGLVERHAALAEEPEEAVEVVPVVTQRVRRAAPHGFEVAEVVVECPRGPLIGRGARDSLCLGHGYPPIPRHGRA